MSSSAHSVSHCWCYQLKVSWRFYLCSRPHDCRLEHALQWSLCLGVPPMLLKLCKRPMQNQLLHPDTKLWHQMLGNHKHLAVYACAQNLTRLLRGGKQGLQQQSLWSLLSGYGQKQAVYKAACPPHYFEAGPWSSALEAPVIWLVSPR